MTKNKKKPKLSIEYDVSKAPNYVIEYIKANVIESDIPLEIDLWYMLEFARTSYIDTFDHDVMSFVVTSRNEAISNMQFPVRKLYKKLYKKAVKSGDIYGLNW